MIVIKIGSELELIIKDAIADITVNIEEIAKHAMDRNVMDNNAVRRFLELVLLLFEALIS